MTPRLPRFAMPLFVLFLAFLPAVARAQHPVPGLDTGPVTVSGGYARLSWKGCCANGIMVDFAYDVFKREDWSIALLADFSRTSFSDEDSSEIDRTYTGGVRGFFLRGRRINAFAQFTAGVIDFTEEDAFVSETATQPLVGFGAAFLFNLNEYLAFKLQGDWWQTKNDLSGAWEGLSRFVIGGVFRFGGR
jgi:hypothetical protein